MTRRMGWWAAALAVGVALSGCAEPVEDIDRTQANLLRKSDLEGEWYMLQTVVDLPPTRGFTFIGETGALERVKWVLQQDLLVGYRSYEKVRGAQSPSTDRGFDGTDAPIAAFTILEHVDVRRDYNPSTGEQSNVIVEDSQDRPWHERAYVRVDWSRNLAQSFDFAVPVDQAASVGYFVDEAQGGPEAFYRETDADGRMQYFDVVGKLLVEPWEDGCIYAWWGLAATDCAAGEVAIRTSFARVKPERRYEPFHYSDQLMSRFGYFRTEYFTLDEQRGVTDAGRRYLINRHDIWEESYTADGTPIPIAERTLRKVPYYLSEAFPDDDLLLAASQATFDQWNDALHEGLRALLGKDELPPVFVMCHNPVAEGDDAACGAVGFSPRIGDLRYSVLHWVDEESLDGPLGYGPSAADPITGEIIAGKAYVYGAAVNTYASYAVDMVRWFNEQLDFEVLIGGQHFSDEVVERLLGKPDVAKPAAGLDRVPLSRTMHAHRERPRRPAVRRAELKPYDADAVQRRLDAARAAGHGPMLLNDEAKRALARQAGADWDTLDDATRDRLDPTKALSPVAMKRRQALRKAARARSIDFRDMVAADLQGIVRSYAGRTDYDTIWREIRAEIYAATAEHEVGHTLGLRHNFQGSYDSLNYPDEYWQLREENLFAAGTLADIYRLTNLTEAQHEGQMRQLQYSSIMDYGFGWESDLKGLGKYDKAALVFGYTAGSRPASGARCGRYPSVPQGDGCLANEPGLVQVFEKSQAQLGRAGDLLDREERGFTYDDSGLPGINILERFHYTTVALQFPALSDLLEAGRTWLPYADFLESKGREDRPVRVPYLFCSDEWESGLLSCHAFDRGADPFEMTRAKIDKYRSEYPFVNFRRDRVGWDVWYPLDSYFWGVFLPLSDYFQSWYVAPYDFDPLFDRTYDLAIHAGFNLLAEVLATPPYGTYCEGNDGALVHLSDEPELQGEADVDPDCKPGGDRMRIDPGVGRRRFSTYDPNEGYYFELKPREAGHYWTTLAAVWAMVDPDAYVIGVDGDVGTYAISYYDWFGDELEGLVNDLLTESYARFAPRATMDAENVVSLKYVPPAKLYDRETGAYYDAETGQQIDADPTAGPLAGPQGLCATCTADRDCAGHTGGLGGTFCQPIDDSGDRFCLQDCTNDDGLCPAGTACDDVGNCVPEAGDCAPLEAACGANAPLGTCDSGTCVDGTCEGEVVAPPVETNPTFALQTDLMWYGFLFTTASYSTRFNDQLNVFRPGSNAEVVSDPETSERHTFTDPLSGVTYAAVQPRCAGEAAAGGPRGLCAPCTADTQCAGHTGFLGGTYCQPLAEGEQTFYCLQDCTNDDSLCAASERCDEVGNCVPKDGACDAPAACDEDNPLGTCPEGQTCTAGACVEVFTPSAHCTFLRPDDTGAVRMVERGNTLAAAYNEALEAWYTYDGPDEATDDRLARAYFTARFELTSFVDLMETLLATYDIFGRVY